jgi:probable phosphoglycerate mutase
VVDRGYTRASPDLPLTERKQLKSKSSRSDSANRFATVVYDGVRAQQTCELAGCGNRAEIDPDLIEWNYGEYEGRLTTDVHKERPGWQLFGDGCPGGELPGDVGSRADRVVRRMRAVGDNVLIFSSGQFLRVLAARWIGLEATFGRCFVLSTASVSALSYEHKLSQPVIRLWDDTRHVGD